MELWLQSYLTAAAAAAVDATQGTELVTPIRETVFVVSTWCVAFLASKRAYMPTDFDRPVSQRRRSSSDAGDSKVDGTTDDEEPVAALATCKLQAAAIAHAKGSVYVIATFCFKRCSTCEISTVLIVNLIASFRCLMCTIQAEHQAAQQWRNSTALLTMLDEACGIF
jgi:hypothetical protein